MGLGCLADCVSWAGLVKTPKKSFKRKRGLLPDTLQAGACIFPPFLTFLSVSQTSEANTHVPFLQFLPTGQYGLCFGYSVPLFGECIRPIKEVEYQYTLFLHMSTWVIKKLPALLLYRKTPQ